MKIFFSVFLISVFSSFLFSQPTNNQVVCTEEFSTTLVKQQLTDSSTILEPEKKIKILVKIAGFLWNKEKEDAREFFRQAYQIAEDDFAERDNKKKEYEIVPDHRSLVLTEVARKDAGLSRELRKKYLTGIDKKIVERQNRGFGKYREIHQILNIVSQIAETNPELAIQIGRDVTKYEISNVWYFGLYQIAQKNQAVADILFQEVLAKNSNSEVFRLLYLSAYPFMNGRIFGVEKNSLGTNVPKTGQPNPNLQIAFLNILFNRILLLTPEDTGNSLQRSFPETTVALSAIRDIEPLINNFPALKNKFNQAKTHVNSLVSNEMLDRLDRSIANDKIYNSSFESKIENLKKLESKGNLTEASIFSVIFSLQEEKHFKELEPWLIKFSNSKAREDAEQYFYYKRTQVAIEDKRLEDARTFSEKVVGFIYKSNLNLEIAQAELKNNQDKYMADQLLSKVFISAAKAEDSATKARIFFGLTNLYTKFDSLQATQSLNKAIEITNKLKDPDIFSNNLSIKVVMKNSSFYTTYRTVGLNMEEVFRELSKKDFAQSIGYAQSFADAYFRTIAVISAVDECQKNKTPKLPKTVSGFHN